MRLRLVPDVDARCGLRAGGEPYAHGVTLGDFAVSGRCAARPEDLGGVYQRDGGGRSAAGRSDGDGGAVHRRDLTAEIRGLRSHGGGSAGDGEERQREESERCK